MSFHEGAAWSWTKKGTVPFVAATALACALLAVAEAPSRNSVPARLAASSLLLDGATSGDLMVVVGERGHILTSRDDGRTWSQKPTPTRALLTAVFLLDDKQGWAVGHDAVILRTRDAGESWELVHDEPDEQRPLLDVRFSDADNGVAIGAYGYFLTTADGGDTWTLEEIEAEGDILDEYGYGGIIDYHLNSIERSASGKLYIAAEAGTIYRSDDDGASWKVLPSPYEGSFFGMLPGDGDDVLVFGLRGNLFRSTDAGDTWEAVETSTVAMLTDAVRLDDGTVIVSGLAGAMLVSRDAGATFALMQTGDRQGVSTVLPTRDGALVFVGESGVRRVEGLLSGGEARE